MRISGHKVSLTAQIGIVIVAINLIVAVFAPLIAPFDPDDAARRRLGGPERAPIGWDWTIWAATF